MRLDFCELLPVSWCMWLNFGFAALMFVAMLIVIFILIVMLIAFWKER